MKLKKKDLVEIIDTDGHLIGKSDIPTHGADLETQASNTTDYNAKVGQQPFRYDMLGRFGFTLMPFLEGKENQGQKELLDDLIKLMHERFVDIISHYYRNPNKLKPDYRKESEGQTSEEAKKFDAEYAKKIVKIVEKHFEGAFKEEPDMIDESIIEEKLIDKKSEGEITKKSDDKGVREKKLEKIAGLINKLDKQDINKLMNLLESGKEERDFSPQQKQKIENFVLNYKGDFKDEDIHGLADEMGLEKPEVEEYIYGIARKELKR